MMTLSQVAISASQNPEPLVVGALVAGAGVVILWFAQKVLWLIKTMQAVLIALSGNPEVPAENRNGFVQQLETVADRLETHVRTFERHVQAEESWQKGISDNLKAQNGRFQEILSNVEKKLERRNKAR